MFIVGIIIAIRKKTKKKNLIILLIITTGIFKVALAQNNVYTVKGKILLPKKGGFVYLYMVDENYFHIPRSGLDTLKYKADKSEITFNFKNVKSGKYAIRCFQDENDNGKLDKGLFGPTEPYGFSWKYKKTFPFDFDDVAFIVNKNTYIKIIIN